MGMPKRKRFSRRERKEQTRREQNRKLRLVKSYTGQNAIVSNVGTQRAASLLRPKAFAPTADGTALLEQEPTSLPCLPARLPDGQAGRPDWQVSETNAAESGFLSANDASPPPSGRVLHAVPAPPPAGEDDDAPIWVHARRAASRRVRSQPSYEIMEKRDTLMQALADYLDATRDTPDRFYRTAFALEGRLLRHARNVIAERAYLPPLPHERGRRNIRRNAVRERQLLDKLETILLDLVQREIAVSHGLCHTPSRIPGLIGFSRKLWISRYTVRAEETLGKLALGEDITRFIQDRLSRATRCNLFRYSDDSSTALGWPTTFGVHLWGLMRKRLARGTSELARVLKKEFEPSL